MPVGAWVRFEGMLTSPRQIDGFAGQLSGASFVDEKQRTVSRIEIERLHRR